MLWSKIRACLEISWSRNGEYDPTQLNNTAFRKPCHDISLSSMVGQTCHASKPAGGTFNVRKLHG
jgi:hypothetical protein